MSDGSVVAIVTGVVTIVTTIVGFLTLWVKIKYGVVKAEEAAKEAAKKAAIVEGKVDDNTTITTQAKDAAEAASAHADTCNEERALTAKIIADHSSRIGNLEAQMTQLKSSVDAMGKNIDSTRHEMRGQLQAIVSKMDLVLLKSAEATASAGKAKAV